MKFHFLLNFQHFIPRRSSVAFAHVLDERLSSGKQYSTKEYVYIEGFDLIAPNQFFELLEERFMVYWKQLNQDMNQWVGQLKAQKIRRAIVNKMLMHILKLTTKLSFTVETAFSANQGKSTSLYIYWNDYRTCIIRF